jgi:HTH-type transcriptional regulator, competence development regulator
MGKLANEVGRFLRKLRIDNGEILYDMAQKLNCSTSYISALELGKRRVNQDFRNQLCKTYSLSPKQCAEFDNAISLSQEKIEIGLEGLSQNSKELLLAFARKVETLNEEETSKLLEFLTKRIEEKDEKKEN